MFDCPYCEGSGSVPSTTTRPRPDTQEIRECQDCSGHFMKHVTGRTYPLTDRTNSDTDAVTRIVD